MEKSFIGNFIYDGAVLGYELFKEENGIQNDNEVNYLLLFELLKYEWPKEHTYEVLKEIVKHLGGITSDGWYRVLTLTNVNKISLLKLAYLFEKNGNNRIEGLDDEFFKRFLPESYYYKKLKNKNKKKTKKNKNKKKLKNKNKKHEFSDFSVEYDSDSKILSYKGKLPEINKEIIQLLKPYNGKKLPSLPSSNATLYVRWNPFDIKISEKSSEESPKMRIANMPASLSFMELFPSEEKNAYSYFTNKIENQGNLPDDFEKIWPFYSYAFTNVNGKNIFIYHPDKRVAKIVNKQLKKLVSEKTNHPIFKALIRTYHRYHVKSRHQHFTIIIRGQINNQKAKEYRTIYISEALERFVSKYPSLLDQTISMGNKNEYLFMLLTKMDPVTIARKYALTKISGKDKNSIPSNIDSHIYSMQLLTLYQMFLEKYSQKTHNPFAMANVSEEEPVVWISRDLPNLFKDETDQVLLSFVRSMDVGDFISYAIKKILESGKNKDKLLRELDYLLRYERAWIPFIVYVILKLKGGRNV